MATRANAVAEFDGQLCTDIAFHLPSIVPVVADLLAARTHTKEAVELLHACKSIIELPHSAGKALMKLKDAQTDLWLLEKAIAPPSAKSIRHGLEPMLRRAKRASDDKSDNAKVEKDWTVAR